MYAGHGPLCLMFFRVASQYAHGLPFAQIAPKGFGVQLGVRSDHRIGGLQNTRCRTVVLLELDDFELRVVVGQSFEVVQGGTPPTVD